MKKENTEINSNKDEKRKNEKKGKNSVVIFNIIAVIAIIIFCFALSPKGLQNDTFYTIKLGQQVRETGIDHVDHYSMHDIPYEYPHWMYDVGMSYIYDYLGGWDGVYVSTIVFAAIFGLILYFTNMKFSKNQIVSLFLTFGQLYLLKDYIAARAQLLTFILFALTVLFIECFLKTKKKRYALGLIIIPILIANLHSAVFPFYFVLYLPYIAEYIIYVFLDAHLGYRVQKLHTKMQLNKLVKQEKNYDPTKEKKNEGKKKNRLSLDLIKSKIKKYTAKLEELDERKDDFVVNQEKRRKEPYKIKMEKYPIVKWLIVIMIICIFTGFLTPIGDLPFSYTVKTMQGNTTSSISEHLPLTLINNKPVMLALAIMLALLIFTDTKIRLSDFFMVLGLTYLSFMTRRQVSMLVIFGGFVLARMIADFLNKYDKKGSEKLVKNVATAIGATITLAIVVIVSYSIYRPKMKHVYIDESNYPVNAAIYIKENLDYKNIKLFNDYNYGSYLMYEDIPVFIDSRCDLYTPEFNGTKNKETGKYEGKDIFSDYINVSNIGTYYKDKMKEYDITHIISKNNSKLNMFLSRDSDYNEIYKDDEFVLYEVVK